MIKLDLTRADHVSVYEDPQTAEVHIDFEYKQPNFECEISIRGEDFQEALFYVIDYIKSAENNEI
jgi:hypothetical protein